VCIILIIDSGKGNDKNPFPLFVVVLSAEHTGDGDSEVFNRAKPSAA
jgi:hypothetical protein